jgi:alanine-synthesizing transaminase
VRFSRRLRWSTPPNALSELSTSLRREGAPILDLTETNPTTASLAYPHDEIAAALADAARQPYEPQPLGLRSAREAVARHLGAGVVAEDVVLTASTSEAYSFLLRLLFDPGDELLTVTPGYPLFEHLAALDSVVHKTFPLELHRRWSVEPERVGASFTGRTRAVAVVSPNNPSGSYITADEQDLIASLCREAGAALISDEVFAGYPLTPPLQPAPSAALRRDVLSFSLGGLSKSAGLPHLKLAWICIGGPDEARAEARSALELIADSYLSVSTPVQAALPTLLRLGGEVAEGIRRRLTANLRTALETCRGCPALEVLPVEGGWSAVLRLPRIGTDEDVAIELLQERRVLVHPGYFFDFPADGFLVVSLLTPETTFATGFQELVSHLARRLP